VDTETRTVAVDGTDALAYVIIRPNPDGDPENPIVAEAAAHGLSHPAAAHVLRQVADQFDPDGAPKGFPAPAAQGAAEQHPAIAAYEEDLGGIPDTFDCFTVQALRDIRTWSAGAAGLDPQAEVDKFVRAHFEYLSTWHDALDGLDSELRCHVVAGGLLPDDQALYLKVQALALFTATTALQRAVCEYHHGTAGPGLSEAYGHAYELSNSALSPF
jgi:hypothetical protein